MEAERGHCDGAGGYGQKKLQGLGLTEKGRKLLERYQYDGDAKRHLMDANGNNGREWTPNGQNGRQQGGLWTPNWG